MLGKLIVVASTTLTFVASCGAPKDTGREPQVGPGATVMIERIKPAECVADLSAVGGLDCRVPIAVCQDQTQAWPGEAIYDPTTGEYTCERS